MWCLKTARHPLSRVSKDSNVWISVTSDILHKEHKQIHFHSLLFAILIFQEGSRYIHIKKIATAVTSQPNLFKKKKEKEKRKIIHPITHKSKFKTELGLIVSLQVSRDSCVPRKFADPHELPINKIFSSSHYCCSTINQQLLKHCKHACNLG